MKIVNSYRAILIENVHQVCRNMIFVCLCDLLSCMLCFHACTHVCFHTYAIPFQMFKKWHNISYCYISYIKSETSNLSRTCAWFLKPFEERVEENHIYHLVKPNSAVKARTVYGGCNICYQVFWKRGKLTLRAKFETLT